MLMSSLQLHSAQGSPGSSPCPCLDPRRRRRPQGNKSFFSEIIASISDINFSKDGRYILSRDYMTLKLWDLNMESAPVATFNVHEHLRSRVSGPGLGQRLGRGGSSSKVLDCRCLGRCSGCQACIIGCGPVPHSAL